MVSNTKSTGLSRRAVLNLVVMVTTLILGVWLGAWYFGIQPALRTVTSQPLADIFSSVNALFAGFAFGGVIITVYLQIQELQETREELQKTAEANSQMAQSSERMAMRSDERAVLDLFQTYCSDYFQTVKDSSMSVLIPCVASKSYCDFVVSRFFVAEQLPFPSDCWDSVSKVTYCKNYDEFVQQEQRFRYKLDELLNFFTLLIGHSNSGEIIRRCDFSYSWWRPLFWMIATQQQKRFANNSQVRAYATPLYLIDVVKKLDDVYGFKPFAAEQEVWDFIVNHPKVRSYGLDDQYNELAGCSKS